MHPMTTLSGTGCFVRVYETCSIRLKGGMELSESVWFAEVSIPVTCFMLSST